jgi:hypothetical protein
MMGGVYPSLGMNAMPGDLDEMIGSRPIAAFNSSQPSMLSIRMKRSAIRIRSFVEQDLLKLRVFDGFVFVREADVDEFEALAKNLGIYAARAGSFKTFYSRQAWVRFARENATSADWEAALKSHSLEALKPTICYYRVSPQSLNS